MIKSIIGPVIAILACFAIIFLLGLQTGVRISAISKVKECTGDPPPVSINGTLIWKKSTHLTKSLAIYYCSKVTLNRLELIVQCNSDLDKWEIVYEDTCDCKDSLPPVTGAMSRIPSRNYSRNIGSVVVYKCFEGFDAPTSVVYRCNESSLWTMKYYSNCECKGDPPETAINQSRSSLTIRSIGTVLRYYCSDDESSAVEKIVRCNKKRKWEIVYQAPCECAEIPSFLHDEIYVQFFTNITRNIGDTVTIYCIPTNNNSGIRFVIRCDVRGKWALTEQQNCSTVYRIQKTPTSYFKAKQLCSKRGGEIATIKNSIQNQQLTQAVQKYGSDCPKLFIGVEENLSQTWTSSDGEPFMFHREVEKLFGTSYHTCVVLWTYGTVRKIYNEMCSIPHCFICYIPNNDDSPYEISKEIVDFQSAMIECDRKNGHLAPLASIDYIVFHMSMDIRVIEHCTGYFFIGGRSIERRWELPDKTPIRFSHWSNMVDNTISDHCVVVSNDHGRKWTTSDCSKVHCSICAIAEKLYWPEISSTDQPAKPMCPEPIDLDLSDKTLYSWKNNSKQMGTTITFFCFPDQINIRIVYRCDSNANWKVVVENICKVTYEPFSQLMSIHAAQNVCRAINGSLAMANSSDDWKLLKTAVKSVKDLHLYCDNGYAIGISENTSRQWQLRSCNENQTEEFATFMAENRTYWADPPNYPSTSNKQCVAINKLFRNKLTNEYCEDLNCFLCENFNLTYEAKHKFLPFSKAWEDCIKRKQTLAMLGDAASFSAMQKVIADVDDFSCKRYFIGMFNERRHFNWLNGKPVPSNITDLIKMRSFQNNCVSLKSDDKPILRDIHCENVQTCFTCQISSHFASLRQMKYNAKFSCLKDFERIGKKCYKFINNGQLESQRAQRHCLSLGGTLANINNKAEFQMLQSALINQTGFNRKDLWHLGLVIRERSITWRNGEKYNNFPTISAPMDSLEPMCSAMLIDRGKASLQVSSFICDEMTSFVCAEDDGFMGFFIVIHNFFVDGFVVDSRLQSLSTCNEKCGGLKYPFYSFKAEGQCYCGTTMADNDAMYTRKQNRLYNYECDVFVVCRHNNKEVCACQDRPVVYSTGVPAYLGCYVIDKLEKGTKAANLRTKEAEKTIYHWCPITCWQQRYKVATLYVAINLCQCFNRLPNIEPTNDDDCEEPEYTAEIDYLVRIYRL